jgi:UDP-2,3-diacylglucosamine pyrophosphatase LpxH
MLVIISDLHLTDGSSGQTIRTGAFKTFRERLRDLAYDASWRSDDKYEPIKELHLVLLGDILDIIRSSKWCDAPPNVRPWGDVKDAEFQKMVASINNGILENQINQKSLAVLKSLNDGKTITVPPATADGKVALVSRDPAARERVPVTVNIYYLVGNHDWFYHLPSSPTLDAMRDAVIDAIGLANPHGAPFPHDPADWPDLQRVYQDHRVFARHGDIFDVFNFEGNRNASSLGDAIVIELLNRFPSAVAQRMGNQLPQACQLGLREIDNVRPLLIIPVWIDGLLRATCTKQQGDQIKSIWDDLVDDFLNIPFVKQHKSIFHPLNSVGELELVLKFSRGVSLANLSKLISWARARFGGSQQDVFYPNAFSEKAFQDGSADFVVYGHTHHYEIVPLRSIPTGGATRDQIYINSGTWRAVHELALFEPNKQEFVGYHVMTYLTFFKGDERKKRQFETWTGSLDTSAQ